jgi:hypothetical protein
VVVVVEGGAELDRLCFREGVVRFEEAALGVRVIPLALRCTEAGRTSSGSCSSSSKTAVIVRRVFVVRACALTFIVLRDFGVWTMPGWREAMSGS